MSKRNTSYIPKFRVERTPDVYTVSISIPGESIAKLLGRLDQIHRISPRGTSYDELPESTAYFCPSCGDIWARLRIKKPEKCAPLWISLDRLCRQCGDGSVEPFLGGRHDELVALFNTSLWMREFMIECEGLETQAFLKKHGIIEHIV